MFSRSEKKTFKLNYGIVSQHFLKHFYKMEEFDQMFGFQLIRQTCRVSSLQVAKIQIKRIPNWKYSLRMFAKIVSKHA